MLKKIILCTTVFGLNFIVAGNELPQEEQDLYPQELQDVNEADLDASRSRLLSKIQQHDKIARLEKRLASMQRLRMRENISYRRQKLRNTFYNPTENHVVDEDKEFFNGEYLALISDLADVNFELYEMNDVLGNFIYANTDVDYEYCLMMAVKLLRTHFCTNLASEHGCTELFNECSVFIEDLINTEIDNTPTANNKVQEAFKIYNDSLICTEYSVLYLKKLVILCKEYYMLRNRSSSDIVLKETFGDVISELDRYSSTPHNQAASDVRKGLSSSDVTL